MKKNPFPKIPEQISRLIIVFLIFIGSVIIVRVYLIPPSLKETGFQRKSAIKNVISLDIKYAGSPVCTECHDKEHETKREGYHKNLACETCHGALKTHADNPETEKPTPPRERGFCSICHVYNPSRPTGFPQINPVVHNPMQPCIECHDPHNPVPPETPQECVACHESITKTKAVSNHALLSCTKCHDTPEEHKLKPRIVRANKPVVRAFCGKCHSKDSSEPDAPKNALKIDLSTHGEKYLCWDCHYPHLPEAK